MTAKKSILLHHSIEVNGDEFHLTSWTAIQNWWKDTKFVFKNSEWKQVQTQSTGSILLAYMLLGNPLTSRPFVFNYSLNSLHMK